MRRVALTGGIATGKSYVRARLAEHGVPTIDADVLARAAVEPGTPGFRAIVSRFGPEVVTEAGTLDRSALGAIVFADPSARRDLEAIVHPAVRQATDAWFESLDPAVPFAVADIPLLYEVGRDRDFHAVIVTACPPSVQLERLMARDGMTQAAAQARIDAQWPIEEKVRRADYVVDTGGTRDATAAQVEQLLDRLGRERAD